MDFAATLERHDMILPADRGHHGLSFMGNRALRALARIALRDGYFDQFEEER